MKSAYFDLVEVLQLGPEDVGVDTFDESVVRRFELPGEYKKTSKRVGSELSLKLGKINI